MCVSSEDLRSDRVSDGGPLRRGHFLVLGVDVPDQVVETVTSHLADHPGTVQILDRLRHFLCGHGLCLSVQSIVSPSTTGSIVQRQLITSAAGPRGSPGKRSCAPPTRKGSRSRVRCWSASWWVGRVRLSSVAIHCLNGAGSPRCSASSSALRHTPALTAPIVSVRATVTAR